MSLCPAMELDHQRDFFPHQIRALLVPPVHLRVGQLHVKVEDELGHGESHFRVGHPEKKKTRQDR